MGCVTDISSLIDTIIEGDCLEVMRGMPDSCVDLIATDPPYFKVKNEAWDRQWDKPKAFITWIGLLCEQWLRILKPNGSLYCFASPQMVANVEVAISKFFNVLNSIRWVKTAGWHNKTRKEELRKFLNPWEAIIFAEHYGADNIAKGEAGYGAKCDELRGFVFEPLRAYLANERDRAGIDKSAGGMASHYFGRSQWCLPTAEHYVALRKLFNAAGGDYLRREYEDLRREYEDLRREYEDLRREYEDLRRPFNVTTDMPYTDVWTFPTVSHYPGKHPCEKPLVMMQHIIKASSHEGALVLDCFAGSGTTCLASSNAGRHYIGIEINHDFCCKARARMRVTKQTLFTGEEVLSQQRV